MSDALTDNVLGAQFDGVPFPVSDSSANGSRSHVAHMAYQRAGADLEDCGLDAYTGTLTVPLINTTDLVTQYGVLYPDLRNRLIARFEQEGVKRFVHPIRGPMDAMIVSWPERADSKMRGGVILTLTWIEHNNSSLVLLSEDDSVPVDYESAASSQAQTVDAYMNSADPGNSGGWQSTSVVVKQSLTDLSTASSFGAIDSAIRAIIDVVAYNLTLAVFSAASSHNVALALYTLQGTAYQLRTRALGQLLSARTIVTPRTMAAWQIAQEQYGDQSLSSLIMQANAFEDPLAIPAGASVLIPTAP